MLERGSNFKNSNNKIICVSKSMILDWVIFTKLYSTSFSRLVYLLSKWVCAFVTVVLEFYRAQADFSLLEELQSQPLTCIFLSDVGK